MKTFNVNEGCDSQKIEADDVISAAKKFAEMRGWDTDIGARLNSNLGPTQVTIGSNVKSWHQVYVS